MTHDKIRIRRQLSPQDFLRSRGLSQDAWNNTRLAAYSDPNSEVRKWADQVDAWADKTFGIKHFLSSDFIRSRVNSNSQGVLDRVLDFIKEQQENGALTQTQTEHILKAVNSSPNTRDLDCISIAARAVESIVECSPGIVGWSPSRSARSR